MTKTEVKFTFDDEGFGIDLRGRVGIELARRPHSLGPADWQAVAKKICDHFNEPAAPTAPEPSAPADKDAERYRWLREDCDRRWWVLWGFSRVLKNGDQISEEGLDKAIDNAMKDDAAIARMRSESGKGGKL